MKKLMKGIYYCSFIIYFLVLLSILLLSRRHVIEMSLIDYIKYSSNIIPFKTIYIYINALIEGSMNIDIPIKNLLGNMLLFFPMGLYLPYIFKKQSIFRNYVICIAIILISVEIGQLILKRGNFDIDDFILNIIGAMIGFAIGKLKWINFSINVLLVE